MLFHLPNTRLGWSQLMCLQCCLIVVMVIHDEDSHPMNGFPNAEVKGIFRCSIDGAHYWYNNIFNLWVIWTVYLALKSSCNLLIVNFKPFDKYLPLQLWEAGKTVTGDPQINFETKMSWKVDLQSTLNSAQTQEMYCELCLSNFEVSWIWFDFKKLEQIPFICELYLFHICDTLAWISYLFSRITLHLQHFSILEK